MIIRMRMALNLAPSERPPTSRSIDRQQRPNKGPGGGDDKQVFGGEYVSPEPDAS
jgi:hypothetical protein